MQYCSNCGNQTEDGVNFCKNCGAALDGGQVANNMPPNQQGYQQGYQSPYQAYPPMQDVLQQLSGKIRTQGIIWMIVCIIQYLAGTLYFYAAIDYSWYGGFYVDEPVYLVMGIFMILVAAVNTVLCVTNFKYSQEILQRPIGILNKYMPVGGIIGMIIYNILFGGLVGIVGAIYAFTVRSFVLTNQMLFAQKEREFMAKARISQNAQKIV